MSLVLDRYGIAGRSEDESHGQAPFPQHRIQTEDCPVAGETLHGLAKRHDISRNLIRISGYYEWQNTPSGKQPWYLHRPRWLLAAYRGRSLGRMEQPRDWRAAEILRDDRW